VALGAQRVRVQKPRLRKCLATTNVIESSLSGVAGRTRRVTRWRCGGMVLRWAAAAALETERHFRKIMGHRDLWMLRAALDDGQLATEEWPIALDKEPVAAQNVRGGCPTLHYSWDIIKRNRVSEIGAIMKNACSRRLPLIILSVFLPLCLLAVPLLADTIDPPARVARLSYAQGNISLQPAGEDQWTKASTNYTVTTGDRLYTDQYCRAELEVGRIAIRMSETTDLTVTNLNDQLMQIGVGQGSVRVTVFDLPADNSVEIDTPNGALTLLRAGSYRVDVDPDGGSTLVIVNSGSLEVSGAGVSQTVQAGEAVQLTGTEPTQITLVSMPNQDDFDRWCADRDQRIRSFAARQYVNPFIPGVEDLDAYGRWEVVAEYGPVWYPSGVPVGWVPYRVGRWAWVEPWGWTWVEDEPWGFCPFHYGRWALIRSTWGWIPGPVADAPVYAPALVAFVGGNGFSISIDGGVQAWFPLGPREPFLPWYHHGNDYLRRVNIANDRNIRDISNLTNITNMTGIHYVNKPVATTAVPTDIFSRGLGVGRRTVRVPPQQVAAAQVLPYPRTVPTETAAFRGAPPKHTARIAAPPTGRPSSPPPLITTATPAQPENIPVRPGRAAPSTGRPSAQPPLNTTTTPAQPQNVPVPPERMGRPVMTRNAPPAVRGAPSVLPITSPHFITRTPPPPREVPFSKRLPALSQHPGLPLEPQQKANLRAGKPAGPMKDKVFPPHPSPPARAPAQPQHG